MPKAKDTFANGEKSSGFLDTHLINRDDFAKKLGLEPVTMRKFFAKHGIPTRTICRRVLFLMSDFLACVPTDSELKEGEE